MKHINPATEEVKYIDETPTESIAFIVEESKKAHKVWRKISLKERTKIIQASAEIFMKNKETIAKAITEDMGKPLQASRDEIDKAIEKITFFCNNAQKFLKKERLSMFNNQVTYDPLGVVAVIFPWNYPLSTSIISIIPALLCGNSLIIKSSEYVPNTTVLIKELFEGLENLPKNVITTIIGGEEQGEELVKQDIDMISFTGSTTTGKKIMKNSAPKLPKLLFELGGLDAAIVLKDVDPSASAKNIVRWNTVNSGQVCCAIKRVYVEKEKYDQFVKSAVKIAESLKIGNPLEADVSLGPIVSETQLRRIESFVEDAVGKGAKILTGGKRLDRKGYFFPPTIIVNVNNTMQLMNEEPFGPILPICSVENWKEAVNLANGTNYGLCGSVWTKDMKLGMEIAKMLEVGVASINNHGSGPSGTPWGGVKESGIGRLNSKEGFRAFANVKLIRK